ncbi:MAG: dihydrofolate reductase family protein [Pseudonocardiaceae bacterium]|nr:dihydrofolate reductase family protein [Pseudonocardiaceae bacterium]
MPGAGHHDYPLSALRAEPSLSVSRRRPYVVVSVATSIDGYIDDMNDARLMLSNEEDLDRVDEVRASVDAILVGANTVRRDDPQLLIRSPERQKERVRRGLTPHPLKATLTSGGGLDATARFFSSGDVEKIVYAPDPGVPALREALGGVATVVAAGQPIDLGVVLDDLAERGVGRLMVEGGGITHTQLLTAGLVDEIHLVIAPFFVGDREAPRFVHPSRFPQNSQHPMTLVETRQIGDAVLLRYLAAA